MLIADRQSPINVSVRVNVALALMVAVFSVVVIRLWYLQILMGVFFRDKSENNRLQTVFIPPPRGRIFDRNGIEMVGNRPSFNVELTTENSSDIKQSIHELATIVGIDPLELGKRAKGSSKRRKFEPKLLLKDVSRDLVAKISAARYKMPGISIAVVPAREYRFSDEAAHVIGYVREITQKQLESPNYPTYKQGDIVGQSGIEAKYEEYLQGQRGRQRVIVNATGTRMGELSSEEEIAGHILNLTIDSRVQAAADLALSDKRGAIVAIDPKNGEVLALASSPRFNPSEFVGEISADTWKDFAKNKTLTNRALQGAYPPGSVFKAITSVAGLAEGVIKPNETVFCGGGLSFAGRLYRCHKKEGHGSVNLISALTQSCDVYYYTVGQRLGVDRIYDYSTRFGLGIRSGIDVAHEVTGLIPSSIWKRRTYNEKWYPGETLSVAIGQGAVTVTPLQVANSIATIINGGNLYKPHLVRSVVSEDGRVIVQNSEPILKGKIGVDQGILKMVRDAMVSVVNDPRGTGHRAKVNEVFGIKVGGKTGTAQVVGLHHGTKGHLNDHAWFVGFAPAEDPTIVVSAIVENGGHGGVAAAPLVRQVLERYFDPEQKLNLNPPATLPQTGTAD